MTARQMREAEQYLIDAGSSVEELMDRAGRGAAEWIWRLCGGRAVTVLCGPGNNGGDGYVIARVLQDLGCPVVVRALTEPRTPAAIAARRAFSGTVVGADAPEIAGDVLVDCLFGTGASRPLDALARQTLQKDWYAHQHRVAVDLPSGVNCDTGAYLGPGSNAEDGGGEAAELLAYDLTIALGAWKPAHFLMPACANMGQLCMVPLGLQNVQAIGSVLRRPKLTAPTPDMHKYYRGALSVIAGDMPGAAMLACRAAQRAGPGYVKLLGEPDGPVPSDLVVQRGPVSEALMDSRFDTVLIGPGLGRGAEARRKLEAVLAAGVDRLIDADALHLLQPGDLDDLRGDTVLTPHAGEMAKLEEIFGLSGAGTKMDRAVRLAEATGASVVFKGPDTVSAAMFGGNAFYPRATPWLSVAGSGDVLAGIIAGRMACGSRRHFGINEGLWIHAEAARLCGPAFTAGQLADRVPQALENFL